MNKQLDPSPIFQTGFAFWNSKVLLSAIKLEIFTILGDKAMSAEEIRKKLKLHPRGIYDFLDCLVAMEFLQRDGNGPDGKYRNTPLTAQFLNKGKPPYVGGIMEMMNDRLYRFWGDLEEGLRTGQPQNEIKHNKKPFFEELYADPVKLELFLNAMAGISRGNFQTLAEKFDFSKYQTLLDVGGAMGTLSIVVAQKFPKLQCLSFDLPQAEPIAKKTIAKEKLSTRVKTVSGDFFKEALPKADVVTMGMILHDWNLENKRHLIKAAYDALPAGGAFIAVENLIDDERRKNVFGLLMSLNMLIELGDGFDFSFAQFKEWCKEAGFKKFEKLPLAGPSFAAVAYK